MSSVPILWNHGSGARPPPGGRRIVSHAVERERERESGSSDEGDASEWVGERERVVV